MRCAAIMTKNPVTLDEDQSVASAAEALVFRHEIDIPVVDAQGCFVGMFGVLDLLCLLVPRVALAGDLMPNLRFLGEDTAELRRRYEDVKTRRLGDAADRNAVSLSPDTPQIEAIRLFCQNHKSLAVTEPQSRKVVGVISYWDAIRAITEPPDR